MKAREIREGDIVEIDYVTEFTKEHMNEGKALVIWKGFNNQPLVRKLDTKAAIWTCYEHIARVVGHIDIVEYMDRALSAEPCDDCISRQAVLGKAFYTETEEGWSGRTVDVKDIEALPPVTPKEKTGKWIVGRVFPTKIGDENLIEYRCSECDRAIRCTESQLVNYPYCHCGAKMVESQESEDNG